MIEYMYNRVADLYVALFGIDVRREHLLYAVIRKAPPSSLARALHLYLSLDLPQIVKKLRYLVQEAERFALYERFVALESSWEVRGSILWSQSVQLVARFEPPLQQILVRDPRSVENLLLLMTILAVEDLLSRVKTWIDDWRRVVRELPNIVVMRGSEKILLHLITRDLEEIMKNAEQELVRMERSPLVHGFKVPRNEVYRQIKTLLSELRRRLWKPRWVNELMNLAYKVLELRKRVEELRTVVLHRSSREVKLFEEALRYWSWRLYEVYAFLVLLEALKRMGFSMRMRDWSKVVALFRGEEIRIHLNEQLEDGRVAEAKARWLRNGEVPKDLLHRCRGRPDVSVVSRKPIIIVEAKFSRKPSYLTVARFKIMAYAYEYEPRAAILVYPGVAKSSPIDDEELETLNLLKEAESRDGIVLELRNGTKLYLIPLIPCEEGEEKAVAIFENILRDVFTF